MTFTSAVRPTNRSASLLRGLLGWLVLCAGLGLSIGLVQRLDDNLRLPAAARFGLQAALMSVLVVPTILRLQSRRDRGSLRSLGWARPVVPPLALGVAVGLVSGLVAWVPAVLAGWVRIDHVDVTAFAGFLGVGGVVLVLYEALPEELALRGYTWTNLRDGWGTASATAVTTALFPLTTLAAGLVAAAVVGLSGGSPDPILSFPGGDALAYVVQLVFFGLALTAARRTPLPGALFAAVAFHWTSLTVTRTLLGGLSWLPSGWTVTLVEPDAIALVLVQVVVGGLLFLWFRAAGRGSAEPAPGSAPTTHSPRAVAHTASPE